MTDISYCGQTVRKHDPDRFLLSMFAPAAAREDLWALYAFNHEIAKTREVVTETQLGLIRLQWWRDEIGKVYDKGGIDSHPVLQDLSKAIERHGLTRALFDNLIYAREFDLEDRQPSTIEGMVKYAELTSAPLMSLALSSIGASEDGARISTAYALTGILRATPAHLRQRLCYLPENLTPHIADHYEGRKMEELRGVVHVVTQEAENLLAETKPAHKFLRVHAALTKMHLAQIKKSDFDLFDQRLSLPPFMRELRLWWS